MGVQQGPAGRQGCCGLGKAHVVCALTLTGIPAQGGVDVQDRLPGTQGQASLGCLQPGGGAEGEVGLPVCDPHEQLLLRCATRSSSVARRGLMQLAARADQKPHPPSLCRPPGLPRAQRAHQGVAQLQRCIALMLAWPYIWGGLCRYPTTTMVYCPVGTVCWHGPKVVRPRGPVPSSLASSPLPASPVARGATWAAARGRCPPLRTPRPMPAPPCAGPEPPRPRLCAHARGGAVRACAHTTGRSARRGARRPRHALLCPACRGCLNSHQAPACAPVVRDTR